MLGAPINRKIMGAAAVLIIGGLSLTMVTGCDQNFLLKWLVPSAQLYVRQVWKYMFARYHADAIISFQAGAERISGKEAINEYMESV